MGQLPHAAFHFLHKGWSRHPWQLRGEESRQSRFAHGCVRISPENVTTLYALVKENGLENTQVVLTGVTPGGEFKYARGQASPGWGVFEPPFGGSYYYGSRDYYRWPSGYSRW